MSAAVKYVALLLVGLAHPAYADDSEIYTPTPDAPSRTQPAAPVKPSRQPTIDMKGHWIQDQSGSGFCPKGSTILISAQTGRTFEGLGTTNGIAGVQKGKIDGLTVTIVATYTDVFGAPQADTLHGQYVPADGTIVGYVTHSTGKRACNFVWHR